MERANHHKANYLYKAKLFSNLGSFAELESRISKISDGNLKGDAFEVFAEACLATQRITKRVKCGLRIKCLIGL